LGGEIAVEAARYLKSKNPQSRVVLRDLMTDEATQIDPRAGSPIVFDHADGR
jgi:hypothetical protein